MRLQTMIAFVCMASASLVGAQTLQTLVSFKGTNGAQPQAALTLGMDGNFYGTTEVGGITNSTSPSGMGTVFKVTTNGTLTTLFFFSNTNGGVPTAGLTLGNDGNFYGTTEFGGSGYTSFQTGYGTVFKITTNGALTTIYSFSGTDGANPQAALTLGNDGNFYGTTFGGSSGGTVFQITTNGVLATLASFNGGSYAGLTLGNDGNLYGTTFQGGINGYPGYGTVFQVTTNGVLTTLVSFNNTNGAGPNTTLTLGNDGNFYGTTYNGGTGSGYGGTIFQVTTNGALTSLVSFSITNGEQPAASLTLGNDGNFYGTTIEGGANGYGTIFQVKTNGVLTTLVSFNNANGPPEAAMTLGIDGNFYGTTVYGGANGGGTVFRLSLSPVINLQPLSQTNAAGSTATFSTEVTNFFPVSYQWQKNGTNVFDGGNLSGANTNTLTITGISDNDAAIYSVIVSNFYGTVTSSNATLTVIDPPGVTTQPLNLVVLPGTNVAFSVSLTGSTIYFRYQWKFNGTNILHATNATYAIPSVVTNNAGNYSVVVTNAAGVAVSSNAALNIVLSPKSQTNYASSTATFTVTAFGTESLNYQWQKNGTNFANGGNLTGATNSTLTIANVSDADAAIYGAVVSDASSGVTTSNATLTVNDSLFIATQPLSQMIAVGSNVIFTATAYGAPPLVFQWYFSNSPAGSPTSGTNVSSYTLTNVHTNQSGNYSVHVINGNGSLTSSNAILTVVSPPVITAQPLNRTNNAASTATFSVIASSLSALSYQWQKNGTNLTNAGKFSGATNSTLTITSVSDNEATIYSVTVSNLAGSATSSNAMLTVIDPPVITTQPLGQRNLFGGGASFTVSVSGTPPFNYQWRFNSANILNATNAIYAIQAIVATNTGNYSVIVTNSAGSVTSSNALLTVLVPPTLALQFLAGYPVLNLNGMLSNNFMVQYSTNLAGTNWINLLSIPNLSASPYQFLDPAGVVSPARFYRAFMQ